MQQRLDKDYTQLAVRSMTVDHPFTMRRLKNIGTEMALRVLAYNMTRVLKIMGVPAMIAAMKA